MRIAKSRFVSPDHNFWFGTFAVAISMFVFAYSSRFGQISILAYYGLWLPLIVIDYRRSLGNYMRYYWILAFAIFACMSVFWSQAFGISARASVQYLTHIVCALIAARTIDARTLTIGSLVGVSLVLVYSLLFGGYHYDPIDGEYSFVGAFASKNQLGFYASLGIYFAFVAIMALRERGIWLLLALVSGLLSGYSLLASASATSIIATGATLAAMMCMGSTLFLRPRTRRLSMIVGILLAIAFVFVALNAGLLDALLGAFGKDTTLTGRTYLWSEGMAAGAQNPYFGVGYQAYWVQGFSEAERLWEEFYIATRSGFHFHNTYIAMYVELGAIGVALFSMVLLTVLFGHLKRLLTSRADLTSLIMFGLAVMLLIRSFFELDMVNPYSIGSFLLYYAAGLLVAARTADAAAPRQAALSQAVAQ
jgi:exopolysaccharide production protein ExoQ